MTNYSSPPFPTRSATTFASYARRMTRFSLLAVLVLSLGACASARRFDVQISGLAHPTERAPQTYTLIPADVAVATTDLQFLEFARSVEVGLSQRGFIRVPEFTPGAMEIAIGYGVGDIQKKTVHHVTPAYAYPSAFAFDYYGYSRNRRGRGRNRGYYGLGFDQSLYFRNQFYAGLPSTSTYTTYNRYLSIEARTLEPGADPRSGLPLWSTRVDSRGTVTDLRRVFPILVSAAVDYLATDTGQQIETRISEDDDRVLSLRRELGASASEAPTDSDPTAVAPNRSLDVPSSQ